MKAETKSSTHTPGPQDAEERRLIARDNEMADLVTAAVDRGIALEAERDALLAALEEAERFALAGFVPTEPAQERIRAAIRKAKGA